MSVTVETLEKLERKITLTLPVDVIQHEVDARLKRMARTVKMAGFRPGKVPMSVVAQRYGYSVHYEVMNDKVGEAFSNAANEAKLRVAGQPRISENKDAPEGALAFDAIFEVFPDVKIGDLSSAKVERIETEVDEAAVDKTLEILRKQRRSFSQRAQDAQAQDGDRVTVDFEGKIDGEPFQGGKAADFQFLIGDGQMLKEFEDAVRGMKTGESRTFPLSFPADYQGKEVAGKTADFMVTVNKIEATHVPDVDDALAASLGIADATVAGLRADIRRNLEREVRFRAQARNKQAVMDALVAHAELDLPKSSVQAELDRMIDGARAELRQRGVKDADKAPIPEDAFRAQAERRVRLGLVVAELVRANGLAAKPEQIKTHVDELASSYEKPAEVVRWYYGDNRRLADVEATVIENNVTEFVLGKAQVEDKKVSFDELMGRG
ncbi:MAG: Cell division trigger factor [Burkholderiaceae bacterium]|jgi:trigger factor|nr:MAG: Cell division trigger factor [Burkholderiaceae bacterium]